MCAVDAAAAAAASSSACRSTKRAHSRWARACSAEASRGGGPSERHETCRGTPISVVRLSPLFACLHFYLSVLPVMPVCLDLHARRVVAAQHGGQ